MQLAAESAGVPFPRANRYDDVNYVYDLEHRSGRALTTVKVDNIAGAVVDNMASVAVCPVSTGATISSVTGGDIVGWDMYGQLCKETVAAAGTSAIAFAVVESSPADAQWVNEFGLPYKYASGGAAGLTFTASGASADARGTFVVDGGVTEPTDVLLDYIADLAQPFGAPYALRYGASSVNDVAYAVTAVAANTGVITVTLPAAVGSEPTGLTISFDDGTVLRADLGDSPVAHTMSPLWMSKYATQIGSDTDALSRLVAVGFDEPSAKTLYATTTGTLV